MFRNLCCFVSYFFLCALLVRVPLEDEYGLKGELLCYVIVQDVLPYRMLWLVCTIIVLSCTLAKVQRRSVQITYIHVANINRAALQFKNLPNKEAGQRLHGCLCGPHGYGASLCCACSSSVSQQLSNVINYRCSGALYVLIEPHLYATSAAFGQLISCMSYRRPFTWIKWKPCYEWGRETVKTAVTAHTPDLLQAMPFVVLYYVYQVQVRRLP